MLKNSDDTVVHGRTVEFAIELDIAIAVVPRNYTILGDLPDGKGMTFKTEYGSVGMIVADKLGYMDGMNEKGLAFGAFFFPEFAEYPEINTENRNKAVSPAQFGNWLLGRFATVDQVRTAIENNEIVIAATEVPGLGPGPTPAHYIVYDTSGNSLVIEPTGGELVLHDNPLGVITNAPTFDWHMTNLRNYVSLDPSNAKPVEIGGLTFSAIGQGSGLVGLPGDFTPVSRFVRAAIFSSTATPSDNSGKGIEQVFHILNNFDIPTGVVREMIDGIVYSDFTMATSARDPNTSKYYYKTHKDQTLRVVDLSRMDFNSVDMKILKITNEQAIIDMSDEIR